MPLYISLCIDTVSLDDIDSQLPAYCSTIASFGAKTERASLFAFSFITRIAVDIFIT